jgi:hypothetical protein
MLLEDNELLVIFPFNSSLPAEAVFDGVGEFTPASIKGVGVATKVDETKGGGFGGVGPEWHAVNFEVSVPKIHEILVAFALKLKHLHLIVAFHNIEECAAKGVGEGGVEEGLEILRTV